MRACMRGRCGRGKRRRRNGSSWLAGGGATRRGEGRDDRYKDDSLAWHGCMFIMLGMMKPAASIQGVVLAAGLAALAVLPSGCDLLTVSQTGRNIREGNDAVARGEVQRAVQYYETALDGTMLSAEAHYRLGLLYEDQLKNQVAALHHFERYLELAPQGQFATDVRTYVERLRLMIVSSLADGPVIPAREAARLKNENLELQKQVAELRKSQQAARGAAVAEAKSAAAHHQAAPPAMVVAATPPPAPPAATPEPEVRRAVPVGAAPSAAGATDTVSASGVQPVPGASPSAAQPPAATRTHTVVKGDTLAGLAQKYYRKSNQWPKIAEANKDVLPDPTKLKLGMVLKIPE